MKKIIVIVIIVVATLLTVFIAFRTYTKSHSPVSTVLFEGESLKMEITYCRPSKKGRVIFGGLEPYGAVWRTGANEATEITFYNDVLFGGQPVKAGRYALFTIPEEKQWTFILNSKLGQWGAFTYDKSNDALRVTAIPVNQPGITEMLTIAFEKIPNGADLSLTWDQTSVVIPITIKTEE